MRGIFIFIVSFNLSQKPYGISNMDTLAKTSHFSKNKKKKGFEIKLKMISNCKVCLKGLVIIGTKTQFTHICWNNLHNLYNLIIHKPSKRE